MTRVLGLSLYGPQAASHRVRLSQFKPGLATSGIDLQIQSLLDNAYLQRSFGGRRPSLRSLLVAYGHRLHALRQAHRFDLAIAYGDLLPYVPGWLERQLLQFHLFTTATTPSSSNTALAVCACSSLCSVPKPIA